MSLDYAMAQVTRYREQSKRWVRRLMELAPLALIRIRTGHPPSPR